MSYFFIFAVLNISDRVVTFARVSLAHRRHEKPTAIPYGSSLRRHLETHAKLSVYGISTFSRCATYILYFCGLLAEFCRIFQRFHPNSSVDRGRRHFFTRSIGFPKGLMPSSNVLCRWRCNVKPSSKIILNRLAYLVRWIIIAVCVTHYLNRIAISVNVYSYIRESVIRNKTTVLRKFSCS